MSENDFLDFWKSKLLDQHYDFWQTRAFSLIETVLPHYGTNLQIQQLSHAQLCSEYSTNPSEHLLNWIITLPGALNSSNAEKLQSHLVYLIGLHYAEFEEFRDISTIHTERDILLTITEGRNTRTFKL